MNERIRGELAPIGISVYTRKAHLLRTVAALQRSSLAGRSDLWIFSDGPRPGDEEAVLELRESISSISGFASVRVVERDSNSRIFNNRGGMQQLLDDYGRVIWLEDDIVTAPAFLHFLNQALDTYQDQNEILSVSGYRPPFPLPEDYRHQCFVMRRFCGWGFATWRDRFNPLGENVPRGSALELCLNPLRMYRFTRAGYDIPRMLQLEETGRIDALDVKLFWKQYKTGQLTVYPSRFLSKNIGHDGSGIHCGVTNRFDVELDEETDTDFSLPDRLPLDPRIVSQNLVFRSGRRRTRLMSVARTLRRQARMWRDNL